MKKECLDEVFGFAFYDRKDLYRIEEDYNFGAVWWFVARMHNANMVLPTPGDSGFSRELTKEFLDEVLAYAIIDTEEPDDFDVIWRFVARMHHAYGAEIPNGALHFAERYRICDLQGELIVDLCGKSLTFEQMLQRVKTKDLSPLIEKPKMDEEERQRLITALKDRKSELADMLVFNQTSSDDETCLSEEYDNIYYKLGHLTGWEEEI